jgi:hypothetical protein
MITIRTLVGLRDRTPTATERDHLIEYAASIRVRQAALQEVEAIATPAVAETIQKIQQIYPHFGRYHAAAWEKGQRDMEILLISMARSMYLDDPALLDEQTLVWTRTILKSFNFTPKFMRDSYTLLREACKKRLKPRSFGLMEPYLNHTIDFLSDIPEPAKPEV